MSEPKKGGRPPLDADDPSTIVSIRMPSRLFDRVYKHATEQRTTVRDVIRTTLDRQLRDDSRQ